ncbi:type II toxin-antitoxin system RelE/ParE family toxin [Rhizobium herbae]|uniref:Plasmid stabilization system protein ParE n=1 Tax=Rhizobium herbae TaxID=508661 RepID=A0ABS4EKW2_9HYPH|nr:type II toxin-antitoxin system RelE/ParE family toxin [Rhizobium herbae]MBP1858555.1 plasmid stabilization system protein ParE [Rhizobium herbae]
MTGYLFYPPADAAQDRIWKETVDQWGEAQAVTYITGLHAHLQKLSATKALWRRLPGNLAVPADLKVQAFFSRCERHYLFFRELPSGKIGVMAILHDRMDIPVRLHEDLIGLADKLNDA